MQFLSAFLFAFSASCDSIIVGLSYGTKKIKISIWNNLLVAIISGIGTFLSMAFGKLLLTIIPLYCANLFGSSIMIIFGIYLLLGAMRKNHTCRKHTSITEQDLPDIPCYEYTLSHPEIIDTDHSKVIEWKETIMLGVVLCFNNVGLGIGASITGINIWVTSASSLLLCFLFLLLGSYLGERILSDKLSIYSEMISIYMILILGIYELFI